MQKTKIEYLDYTWNPITIRCTPVSDGCRNCWHLAMAKRLAKNPLIDRNRQTAYMGGPFLLDQKELQSPLHIRKPSRIGVQFMGDIAHDNIDGFWISAIWGIMAACPHHQFFILTKRPERFLKLTPALPVLDNVLIGASCEDQKTADERIPILLQIPVAKRFVSFEPMLSAITLDPFWLKCLGAVPCDDRRPEKGQTVCHPPCPPRLDWVICGGETGPGARPLHTDWVRSLRDQCQAAGVPFFFKQMGDYERNKSKCPCGCRRKRSPIKHLDGKEYREFPTDTIYNVSKKVSGAVELRREDALPSTPLTGSRLRRENLTNACRMQLGRKGQTVTRWRPTY